MAELKPCPCIHASGIQANASGEETLSRDNGTLHGAYFLTDYCPNYSAKMDGGTTDEL